MTGEQALLDYHDKKRINGRVMFKIINAGWVNGRGGAITAKGKEVLKPMLAARAGAEKTEKQAAKPAEAPKAAAPKAPEPAKQPKPRSR